MNISACTNSKNTLPSICGQCSSEWMVQSAESHGACAPECADSHSHPILTTAIKVTKQTLEDLHIQDAPEVDVLPPPKSPEETDN